MFSLLCKRILPKCRVVGDSSYTRLSFIQTTILPIKPFSSSSSSSSKSIKHELQHSFTVSYLINSCGLPLNTAISVSNKVHFETPERPDSVLTLFRDHGFTNTQITKLIKGRPSLLSSNPGKTLLPKLEFFRSIGVSSTNLAILVCSNPKILMYSLENHLKPRYNFLKSLLLDDEKVIKTIKRPFWLFGCDVRKDLAHNIAVLRDIGVPEPLVVLTVRWFDSVVIQSHDKFDKVVKEVIEMGYNTKKLAFVHALFVFSWKSKSVRDHIMDVYRRCGWSEDDVRLLSKNYPLAMFLSEKNITSTMDFLMNKMGCHPTAIARYPLVLGLSLEKRVIPRCSVIKVLQLKGLIKKDLSLGTFLCLTEKNFLDRFLTKYQEHVPHLLNVYQGKMSLLQLGFGSEETCGMK